MFHVKHNANLLFYLPPAVHFLLILQKKVEKENAIQEGQKQGSRRKGFAVGKGRANAHLRLAAGGKVSLRGCALTQPSPLENLPSVLGAVYHPTKVLLLTLQGW